MEARSTECAALGLMSFAATSRVERDLELDEFFDESVHLLVRRSSRKMLARRSASSASKSPSSDDRQNPSEPSSEEGRIYLVVYVGTVGIELL